MPYLTKRVPHTNSYVFSKNIYNFITKIFVTAAIIILLYIK